MIQRTIDIKTTAIAAFEKESKRLLLSLEKGELLIALIDKASGHWNALENFKLAEKDWENMTETLQNVKQQSSLINLRVPDVQLFFRTDKAIPVPVILKEDCKLFLQAQFGLRPPDEMLTEEVSNTISVAVIIPSTQITAFRHVFPQATWHSSLALIIKQAQKAQGNTILPQLFITISSILAEIVFMKSDQLLIARCFQYHTAENLLYHLLNTCNQLRISPAEVFIKVQGQVAKDDITYQLLHEYFSHIELVTAHSNSWGKEFDEIPAHYFTNLMVDL